MTVTLKGFQGTVSDADMATQLPSIPGLVPLSADALVTAVSGARQVSVAPGAPNAHFVKRISDAAETLPLAPPSSGGKWYVIAVNRQWSPTNTATLEAVDVGITNDGTLPTAPPAFSGLPTGLRNNPGTAGSTSAFGHHQPLAWAHVRAADTTVTTFDLRSIMSTAGQVIPTGLPALTMGAAFRAPQFGAVVPTAEGIAYRWNKTAWKAQPNADTFCHVYWNSSTDPNIPHQQWTDNPMNGVVADPSGMFVPEKNGIRAKWGGRYRFWQRLQPLWTQNSGRLITRFVVDQNGYEIAWRTQLPIISTTEPVDHVAEWQVGAGDIIRPQVWQNTGYTQYLKHLDGLHTSNQFSMQFLGDY